jgi:hypothetical protein
MVEKTVGRFFSMAKGGSYEVAVRMVDFLLSLALLIGTEGKSHSSVLAHTPLSTLMRYAVKYLRHVDSLSNIYLFGKLEPDTLAKPYEIQVVEWMTAKFDFREATKRILSEAELRMSFHELRRLAEYMVREHFSGDRIKADAEIEQLSGLAIHAEQVIFSCLFSVVFGLPEGHKLTRRVIQRVGHRKRPSLLDVAERLSEFQSKNKRLQEYTEEYRRNVNAFIENPVIRGFFKKELSASRLYSYNSEKNWSPPLYVEDV